MTKIERVQHLPFHHENIFYMKTSFNFGLGILLGCCTLLAAGQGVTPSQIQAIEERMDDYKKVTNEGNWDLLMDFIYPELFTVASKEELADAFRQVEANGMKMRIESMGADNYESLGQHVNRHFVVYMAKSLIFMQLVNESLRPMAPLIQQQFNGQPGIEEVTYDEASSTLSFRQMRPMIAVQYPDNAWYLLDWNVSEPGQLEAMQAILPAAVIGQMENR